MFSSTLQELHINVHFFDDCVFLLDGRLNQLRNLFINVFHILPLESPIDEKVSFEKKQRITIDWIFSQKKIVNLTSISLTCRNETLFYKEALLPHLHRILNLEELILNRFIGNKENFFDGNHLKKTIINHIPQLRQLALNIRSMIELNNFLHFSTIMKIFNVH